MDLEKSARAQDDRRSQGEMDRFDGVWARSHTVSVGNTSHTLHGIAWDYTWVDVSDRHILAA